MGSDSKVIDIFERRQEMIKAEKAATKKSAPKNGQNGHTQKRPGQKGTPESSKLIDFTARREAARVSERRIAKRTVLSEFVGCFVVVPDHGLQRVNMFEISESGIAFDVEAKFGSFKTGEEVAARVYLSQKSYFSFIVEVTNSRTEDSNGLLRHGAIIQSAENEDALYHFIRFVESVSESLHIDAGDRVAPAHR